MAKAAAETAVLNRELDKLDGTSVRANKSTSTLADQGIKKTGDSTRKAGADLNQFTGRMNLLVKSAVLLGPALVPISAAAVPAIAGLTAGLGATAGAVGVTMLAFHGLGGALQALDQYQLNPTKANLKKLNEAMGALSPQAQELVRRLDEMEPALKRLQSLAGNDMFPGLNKGLSEVSALGPQVREVVASIATEVGHLGVATGENLAHSKDWQRFFDYLRTDAAPTLDNFARATGNLVTGVASMMVALRPVADVFDANLLASSQRFRLWAAGLDQNQDFQHFLAYVREEGPAVHEFFHALAEAVIGLVHATAPFGATVLPILTDVLNVFAAIAKSPIGPVVYDAAAAFVIFGQLDIAGKVDKISTSFSGLGGTMKQFRSDQEMVNTNWGYTQKMAPEVAAANQRIKETYSKLGDAARTAAGPIGLGLLFDAGRHTAGALDTMEKAAGGAAIGFSLAGPWGAAIGGAAGLLGGAAQASGLFTQHLSDTQAIDKARTAYDNLGASLDILSGKFSVDTRQKTLNDLSSNGGLKAASAAGLTPSQAIDVALGEADKATLATYNKHLAQLKADMDRANAAYKTAAATALENDLKTGSNGYNADAELHAADAAQQLYVALAAVSGAGDKATHAWQDQHNALIKLTPEQQKLIDSLHDTQLSLDAAHGKIPVLTSDFARYAHQLHLTPAEVKTTIKALGVDSTRLDLQGVLKQMSDLDKKSARPRISVDNSQALAALAQIDKAFHIFGSYIPGLSLPGIGTGSADGGTVPKTGMPYADRHPYMLADGEEVISNRFGQADRNRGLLKAINAGYLADGGTAKANRAAAAYGIHIAPGESVPATITAFTHALDRATASLQNETQARDTLISTVKSNLTGSLFNQTSTGGAFSSSFAAGSLGSVNAELRKETNDARLQTKLEKNLRGRGLSGAALQDLITNGGLPALQQFAAGSNADLKTYQHLYSLRGTAINEAAGTASSVLGLTSAIAGTNARLDTITAELKALKSGQQSAAKATATHRKTAAAQAGAATAKALNSVAKNGRTR